MKTDICAQMFCQWKDIFNYLGEFFEQLMSLLSLYIDIHFNQKQLTYLKDKETELAVAKNEANELREGFLQLKR